MYEYPIEHKIVLLGGLSLGPCVTLVLSTLGSETLHNAKNAGKKINK